MERVVRQQIRGVLADVVDYSFVVAGITTRGMVCIYIYIYILR